MVNVKRAEYSPLEVCACSMTYDLHQIPFELLAATTQVQTQPQHYRTLGTPQTAIHVLNICLDTYYYLIWLLCIVL